MKIEIVSGGREAQVSRERLRQQSVTNRPPAVHNANYPRKKENDDEERESTSKKLPRRHHLDVITKLCRGLCYVWC